METEIKTRSLLAVLIICLLATFVDANIYSTALSNLDNYVAGYWEFSGAYLQDDLNSIIEEIAGSCGLNPGKGAFLMNETNVEILNQVKHANENLCEDTSLDVSRWDTIQTAQFSPTSPNTILKILTSVSSASTFSRLERS